MDDRGFAPIGRVVEGLDVLDRVHAVYGEGPPRGSGPYGACVQASDDAYLDTEFFDLTTIVQAEPGLEGCP